MFAGNVLTRDRSWAVGEVLEGLETSQATASEKGSVVSSVILTLSFPLHAHRDGGLPMRRQSVREKKSTLNKPPIIQPVYRRSDWPVCGGMTHRPVEKNQSEMAAER